MKNETTKQARLRILRTGDQRSQFYYNRTAKEVLQSLGYPRTLLGSSTKTRKSAGVGVLNRVMYLTPGAFCPRASDACLAGCLGHSSGRMPMHSESRDRKTALFMEDRGYFMQLLRCDLSQLRVDAKQANVTGCVRLNGTSDLPWERLYPELFEEYADLWFVDYTKIASRMRSYLSGTISGKLWPKNYCLTFSHSETNGEDATAILKAGGNVAVVFDEVPGEFKGFEVIRGDTHDARMLDPKGVVVGLKAKGDAVQDQSGFVVRVTEQPTLRPGLEHQLAS